MTTSTVSWNIRSHRGRLKTFRITTPLRLFALIVLFTARLVAGYHNSDIYPKCL